MAVRFFLLIFKIKFLLQLPFFLVAICDAGSAMLCKKIIHVHSPSWSDGTPAQAVNNLETAVRNILRTAEDNSIETIAIPSISSGGYSKLRKSCPLGCVFTIKVLFAYLFKKWISKAGGR